MCAGDATLANRPHLGTIGALGAFPIMESSSLPPAAKFTWLEGKILLWSEGLSFPGKSKVKWIWTFSAKMSTPHKQYHISRRWWEKLGSKAWVRKCWN